MSKWKGLGYIRHVFSNLQFVKHMSIVCGKSSIYDVILHVFGSENEKQKTVEYDAFA